MQTFPARQAGMVVPRVVVPRMVLAGVVPAPSNSDRSEKGDMLCCVTFR